MLHENVDFLALKKQKWEGYFVMDNTQTAVPVAPGWLPYFHYVSVTMKLIPNLHHIIGLSVHQRIVFCMYMYWILTKEPIY